MALLRQLARTRGARPDADFDAHVVGIDRSQTRFLLLNGGAKHGSVSFDIAIIAARTGAAWRPELKPISAWRE